MRTSKKVFREAGEHAIADYPRESCGYIVDAKGLKYVPCTNSAATPNQHFRLGPEEWQRASKVGKIVGVVHSHPDGEARPSPGDLAACEASRLPWHILAVHRGDSGDLAVVDTFSWKPNGYRAPLVGRPFEYGVLDCWSLIRDWHLENTGHDLGDFDRGLDGWWNDLESDFNPYEDPDNHKKAGLVRFAPGTSLQRGDVILMQVRSRSGKPNHAGVLIDEKGTMLHHMSGALSDRIVYGGYWREVTRFILRHESYV